MSHRLSSPAIHLPDPPSFLLAHPVSHRASSLIPLHRGILPLSRSSLTQQTRTNSQDPGVPRCSAAAPHQPIPGVELARACEPPQAGSYPPHPSSQEQDFDQLGLGFVGLGRPNDQTASGGQVASHCLVCTLVLTHVRSSICHGASCVHAAAESISRLVLQHIMYECVERSGEISDYDFPDFYTQEGCTHLRRRALCPAVSSPSLLASWERTHATEGIRTEAGIERESLLNI